MIAKFITLSISELFLRASKFTFFIALVNFYGENTLYEYGYFTALFSILFVFSDFGLQTFLTKELSANQIRQLHVKISLFRIISFIALGLLTIFYFLFSDMQIFIFIFLLFLSDAIFAMEFSYLRSQHNSKEEGSIKFFISLIYFFFSISIYFGIDDKTLFLLISLTLFLYALKNSYFVKISYLKEFFENFNIKTYIQIIKKSSYIFVGALATIFYLRIDILMLEYFDYVEGVALYTIASRILELSLVIPSVISVLLLPYMVKQKVDRVAIRLAVQFLVGLFTMALFFAISSLLVSVLFSKYENSLEIINILLLSIPFMLVNGYIFTLFIAKEKSSLYAIVAVNMAIANTVLNYIFIPLYGYEAAAYTTIITEFVGVFLAIYLLKTRLNL